MSYILDLNNRYILYMKENNFLQTNKFIIWISSAILCMVPKDSILWPSRHRGLILGFHVIQCFCSNVVINRIKWLVRCRAPRHQCIYWSMWSNYNSSMCFEPGNWKHVYYSGKFVGIKELQISLIGKLVVTHFSTTTLIFEVNFREFKMK